MLEHYANIAEIVGVVLVIATLAFLTIEIRHNTSALKATTFQAAMQSEMALTSIIVEHVEVWDKVVKGERLEAGAETRKGIILFNILMIDSESRYHQYKNGLLDSKTWQGRLDTLPEFIDLPLYPQWRQSPGGRNHNADFLALIDELAKNRKEG